MEYRCRKTCLHARETIETFHYLIIKSKIPGDNLHLMNKPFQSIPFIIFLFMFSAFADFASSQDRITDEEEARSIFEEADSRRNSVDNETAAMEMTITDSRGRTRSRTMQSWNRTDDNSSSNLIIFTDPGNVRGTGFLSVTENGNTNQRLYLPSVGRIQVISSAERGDRFMGSDFTYEDLGDRDPDSYEFEWFEEYDEFYVVRASKPDSDQYASVGFEVNKETYALETIRYYNTEGEEIKRLEAEDFEQLTDNLWSPAKLTMYDLREDRKTEITWKNREINTEIEDWRFTERGLRRGI